jgi:malonyl-CoA O-methyltransferase
MLNAKHIRQRFERAANNFDEADFVHATTRHGLLSRLEPLLVEARTVVDLGAATGAANRSLEKRFKGAHVISIDFAHEMLGKARTRKSWLSKNSFVQADACALPLPDESVDVVFSNLLLPCLGDPDPAFSEVARVLRKGGVFSFATLGPDSLQEISRAWRQVDSGAHVNRFLDMHDLGDGLVRAGLSDPVLDVDRLSVSYTSSDRLFADLTAVGARNSLEQRARGLTGKRRFAEMVGALENAALDGSVALDLELVYGHCWGSGPKIDPRNYKIDANQIPVRRPSS